MFGALDGVYLASVGVCLGKTVGVCMYVCMYMVCVVFT